MVSVDRCRRMKEPSLRLNCFTTIFWLASTMATVTDKIENGAGRERQQNIEDFSRTTLHTAAEQGNITAVKYFVSRGDDVNSVSQSNECICTALALAAKVGNIEVVNYLLDNQADVDKKVRYLINHPSGYSEQKDISPLSVSLSNNQVDVAKLLIARGGSINTKDTDGWPPLFYAAMFGVEDMVNYFIEKCVDVNTKDIFGQTALHMVSIGDNSDIAAILIANGAFVNASVGGDTPLHYAAKFIALKTADLLLHNDADVSKLGIDGSAPIHIVVTSSFGYKKEEDRIEMLKVILKHRNNSIDTRNRGLNHGDSSTALHVAVRYGLAEVVQFLVGSGANIDSQTGHYLMTPLHIAALHENVPMFKLLINYGADIQIKDYLGRTPLELAASFTRIQINQFLLARTSSSLRYFYAVS